jgi:hypothetical protein
MMEMNVIGRLYVSGGTQRTHWHRVRIREHYRTTKFIVHKEKVSVNNGRRMQRPSECSN